MSRSNDKRRARINCINHLLKTIPYKRHPHDKVKLARRSMKDSYADVAALEGRRFIPEKF